MPRKKATTKKKKSTTNVNVKPPTRASFKNDDSDNTPRLMKENDKGFLTNKTKKEKDHGNDSFDFDEQRTRS